jgi:two-component system OmpR family response regulator
VETVGTRLQALQTILVTAPDLVPLDVMLPDADGFAPVRQLRAGGVAVPVIFITARDAPHDRVARSTAGGDDYIAKKSGGTTSRARPLWWPRISATCVAG